MAKIDACDYCGQPLSLEKNFHKPNCPAWKLADWRLNKVERDKTQEVKIDLRNVTDEKYLDILRAVLLEGNKRGILQNIYHMRNSVVTHQLVITTPDILHVVEGKFVLKGRSPE